jgi:nucleoside-diphosphate-sugar epimerase
LIQTVFVTGGTGFIGSHTVERLLEEGYNVRCLVRPHQINLRWLQGLPVDIVKGDLLDSVSLSKCLEGADYIIHIAGVTKAKRKSEFFTGNVKATEHLLYAASKMKHLKKFCYLSSLTAVGPSTTGIPLTETAPCRPITTYGQSKLEAEHHCRHFADRMPIVIIRPPAVFGPRDKDILEMFKWVSYGFKPIIGSSEKTLSLVYAPDLAKGIIQATIDERTIGQTYNISNPTIFTFSSLIDYLATLAHKRTIHVHLPKGLFYSIAGIAQFFSTIGKKPAVLNVEKARDLLQKHWVCDSRKIWEHIGFQTSTSIYDGLNKTFQWYKKTEWL